MKVLVFKDIKNKRWTIWDISRKTHLGYADQLTLINCTLFVDNTKRNKILLTKKRFPHAWVIGQISNKSFSYSSEITYNPFKDNQFKKNNKNIKTAKKIIFKNNGKIYT